MHGCMYSIKKYNKKIMQNKTAKQLKKKKKQDTNKKNPQNITLQFHPRWLTSVLVVILPAPVPSAH